MLPAVIVLAVAAALVVPAFLGYISTGAGATGDSTSATPTPTPNIVSGAGVVADSQYFSFGPQDWFYSGADVNAETGYMYADDPLPAHQLADVTAQSICDPNFMGYAGINEISDFTSAGTHVFSSPHSLRFGDTDSGCYSGVLLFLDDGIYGGFEPTHIDATFCLHYRFWYDSSGGSDFSSLAGQTPGPTASAPVGCLDLTPTPSPTPTPTLTPTPTAINTGPACPGAPSPPGGTCPPCPTFNVNALDSTVGVLSTCFPSPSPTTTPTPTPTPTPRPCVTHPASPVPTDFCSGTPTPTPTSPFPSCAFITEVGVLCTATPSPSPYVSPTPCQMVSPTNCDVVYPPLGDADCSYHVDLGDVKEVLRDSAGIEEAQCQVPGNVKCDDGLNPMDALLILEHVADTNPQLPVWCAPFPN